VTDGDAGPGEKSVRNRFGTRLSENSLGRQGAFVKRPASVEHEKARTGPRRAAALLLRRRRPLAERRKERGLAERRPDALHAPRLEPRSRRRPLQNRRAQRRGGRRAADRRAHRSQNGRSNAVPDRCLQSPNEAESISRRRFRGLVAGGLLTEIERAPAAPRTMVRTAPDAPLAPHGIKSFFQGSSLPPESRRTV
jgi:hypothetical protein